MKVFVLLLVMLIIVTSCDKEKDDYPVILTGDVSNIDKTGADFYATIVYLGSRIIIEYGFVWGTTPDITIDNAEKFIVDKRAAQGDAVVTRISAALEKDIRYYVKAYMKTARTVVYGEAKEFAFQGSKTPVINMITPATGNVGDTVIIAGSGFSYIPQNNILLFDQFRAEVLRSTKDTLVAVVPENLDKEFPQARITVVSETATSDGLFRLISPMVVDFSPGKGTYGTTITVTCTNYTSSLSTLHVFLDDREMTISPISDQQFSFVVPDDFAIRSCSIYVRMNNMTVSTPGKFELEYHYITDFEPKFALTGDIVTITGEYFSQVTANNIVKFGGIQVTPFEVSGDQMKAILPMQNQVIYPDRRLGVTVEICGETVTHAEKLEINNKWFRRPDTPSEVSYFDGIGFMYNDKVYTGLRDPAELYEYDPSTNIWTKMPDFPGTRRIKATGFLIGDKFYYGGGVVNGLWVLLNDFWEFDLSSRQWTRKNDFGGDPRRDAGGFSTGTRGFLYGGFNDYIVYSLGKKFNEIWEYNPVTDQWSLAGPLPVDPKFEARHYTHNNNHFLYYCVGYEFISYRFNDVAYGWTTELAYSEALPGPVFGFVAGNHLYYSNTTNTNYYASHFRKLSLETLAVSGLDEFLPHSYFNPPFSFAIGSKVYLTGGSSRVLWEFDPSR